jgi:anti-sigma factor RsiW
MGGLLLSEEDLHAFADNQLPPERSQEVAAVIAREPALAGRVAEIKRQNALLRDALDPWLAETLPRKLLHASAHPREISLWRRLRPALAVAATLVIGVGLGWYGREEILRREGTPVTFSRQAALTHALYAADQNRPVEIWAAEEQRLVTWLSKRINFPLRAPDLNSLGFSLVGGRLVAGNEKPGALFMYENADKQRISLLVLLDRRQLWLCHLRARRQDAAPRHRPRGVRSARSVRSRAASSPLALAKAASSGRSLGFQSRRAEVLELAAEIRRDRAHPG